MLFVYDFNQTWQVLIIVPNIKFYKNQLAVIKLFHAGR